MEELNIERKYRRFTDNIKLTLKKAIERDNFELAENIKQYLAYMDKLKLSKKYNYNVEDVENRIKELQNKIIKQQFNENIYNINSITINLPKYEDKNINYIVLFIYKLIEENSDTLCLLTQNIIEQLFKINLLENINVKEVGFASLYGDLSFGGKFNSYNCFSESGYGIEKIGSNNSKFQGKLRTKDNILQIVCIETRKNQYGIDDRINLTKKNNTYKLQILQNTEKDRNFGYYSTSRGIIGDECKYEYIEEQNAIKIYRENANKTRYYLVVGGSKNINRFYIEGVGYNVSVYMEENLVKEAENEGWIFKKQTLFRFYNINSPYNNITKEVHNEFTNYDNTDRIDVGCESLYTYNGEYISFSNSTTRSKATIKEFVNNECYDMIKSGSDMGDLIREIPEILTKDNITNYVQKEYWIYFKYIIDNYYKPNVYDNLFQNIRSNRIDDICNIKNKKKNAIYRYVKSFNGTDETNDIKEIINIRPRFYTDTLNGKKDNIRNIIITNNSIKINNYFIYNIYFKYIKKYDAVKIVKIIDSEEHFLTVGSYENSIGLNNKIENMPNLQVCGFYKPILEKTRQLFKFYSINPPYNNITKKAIETFNTSNTKKNKICDIFKNTINIVYNNSSKNIELKVDKIVYHYDIINKLNNLISKINKYDINKKLKKYEMELSETTIKNYKIMLVVIVLNILKSTNCDGLNMFNLKKEICKYVKLNVKYEINKEYDILHNYLLTRSLSEIDLYKSKNEEISEIIVPKFSIKFMNILVLYLYNFVVENKKDICKNILKLLKYIKKNINKKLNSFNVSGKPYYEDDKIISLCSNDKNAVNLIHTFYSKYNNFDKLLISKLLKKIIENNGLKVKYNKIRDKFTVSIINLEKMDIKLLYTQEIAKQETIIQKAREKADKLADKASNIIDKTARLEAEIVAEEALQEVARHEATGQELAAEKTIQETKFMEGFNKDLECIDKYINVKIIKRIFENIVNIINIIIDIITDTKLLGNLLNIKTKKIDYLLKNSKINFSIRKLCVIIFIKLIITTISEYHINPHNVGKYILEDTVNEIHNILCKKIKVNFSYNTRELNESIYTSFPTYDIN